MAMHQEGCGCYWCDETVDRWWEDPNLSDEERARRNAETLDHILNPGKSMRQELRELRQKK